MQCPSPGANRARAAALLIASLAALGSAGAGLRPSRSRARLRTRRQADTTFDQPVWSPLAGRSGRAPLFPFSTTYSNGFTHDAGGFAGLEGYLDVPIPNWGIWDLKGNFEILGEVDEVGVGVLARPTNALELSPRATAELMKQYTGEEESAVLTLPSGIEPVKCRPPVCNPFVHSVAAGVHARQQVDTGIEGALDFPIDRRGQRFPLAGRVNTEQGPVLVDYAQHLAAVDPFFKRTTTARSRTVTTANDRNRLAQDWKNAQKAAGGIFRRRQRARQPPRSWRSRWRRNG